MAKHNFLKLEYRTEEVQALEIVGVVDGDGELPAYTTTDKKIKWNAWIVNKNRRLFQFVPVDCNNIGFVSTERRYEASVALLSRT